MIKWHRFQRDIPSLLDKPKPPEMNYRDGILPLNMAPLKPEYQENQYPKKEEEEEIKEEMEIKEEEKEEKKEEKPKKGRKPLDKNKKNP